MVERALAEMQCALKCRDHFGAPWVTGKAVDRVPGDVHPLQDAIDGPTDILLGKGRDVAVEDHTQPLAVDIPSHDVERVRPHMLARAFDQSETGVAGTQDAGGGA